jgi:solute carrier family 25 (adenine nucleotide translocator) protein 4/5/6/31
MKFEGYAGFWKGNFANILRFMSNDVLNFMMKETIQLEVKRHGLASDGSLILNFVSASVGGILTLGFIYPMEYGRTRLTNEIVGKKSAFIILMETFTKEGLKGIYRGSLNYFISAAIFRAFYFGIFDSLKVRYPQNLRNKFCESYVGSVVAIYSVYPFDTIRKRMIMTSGKNYKYQGFVDCARKILQE